MRKEIIFIDEETLAAEEIAMMLGREADGLGEESGEETQE